jgi:hypothetical protein
LFKEIFLNLTSLCALKYVLSRGVIEFSITCSPGLTYNSKKIVEKRLPNQCDSVTRLSSIVVLNAID